VAPLVQLKRAAHKAKKLARIARAMELYKRVLAAAVNTTLSTLKMDGSCYRLDGMLPILHAVKVRRPTPTPLRLSFIDKLSEFPDYESDS
jgi:hypothetical protein